MVNISNREFTTNTCYQPPMGCNGCTTNKYEANCLPNFQSSDFTMSVTGNSSNDDCSGNIAIDAQEGLWNEFVIGPSSDSESGLGLNYKIPFGFIDYRDLGRSGVCDNNNLGRIYKDNSGNTYQYGNYKLIVRDCDQKVIYNEDTRIPVEALSPYDLCTNVVINPLDPCVSCPAGKVLTTVCENGICKVKWLNPAIAPINNYSLSVTDTLTVDLTIFGSNLKADVKLSAKAGNLISVETDGLFAAGGSSDNLTLSGNGTILSPFAIKKVYTDLKTIIGSGVPGDSIRINPCPGLNAGFIDYTDLYRTFTIKPTDYTIREFADEAIGILGVNQIGNPTAQRIGYKTIKFITPALEGNCPDYWWYAKMQHVLVSSINTLPYKTQLSTDVAFNNDTIAIGPDYLAFNMAGATSAVDIRNAINTGAKTPNISKVIVAGMQYTIPSREDYGDSQGAKRTSEVYLAMKPNTEIEMVVFHGQSLPNNISFSQLNVNFETILEGSSVFFQFLGKIKKPQ